jgi:2-polyprenyl-3-methyl-5-hydroxy-6-metoxy-1,4-benzoquinol methylase
MGEYQTPERMAQKLATIPLPADLTGKTVLDLGCDHGFWSKLASDRGASRVLGIDHNRIVRGEGWVDLVARCRARDWPRCEFREVDLGREWPDLGQWDVVLCLAVYHHVYAQAGDHGVMWRWLRSCVAPGGLLLWDGPWDTQDSVAAERARTGGGEYTREAILEAAREVFDVEILGPAGYRAHRFVLRCRPREGEAAA